MTPVADELSPYLLVRVRNGRAEFARWRVQEGQDALALFLTDVFKNAVGRPRPDLIARCKPTKGTPGHGFVTIHVCTEPDRHTLHDGWRSFPSGHSSFAFAGLGYLAL